MNTRGRGPQRFARQPEGRRGGSPQPRAGARRPSGQAARGNQVRRGGSVRGLGGEQVEGRQAVRELLLAGRRRTRTVTVARGLDPAAIIDHIFELARQQKVPLREVSRAELDAAARTEAPQGVIAHADPIKEAELADLAGVGGSAGTRNSGGTPPFLLALDGVTDPGNFGALLRTAECAGVTGVILPRHRSARISPGVTKSASGAVEHLRFAVAPGLPSALRSLSEKHVWTVGLDTGAHGSLFDLQLAGEPVALVLGSEGKGLSRLVAQRCDILVSIPLAGMLGSMNVSAAAAVACFEIVRLRSQAKPGSA